MVSSAQQQYLHCIAQEPTRLADSILDVQRRQQLWSTQMLYQQWQVLSRSVEATVASWQKTDARAPLALNSGRQPQKNAPGD